MTEEQANLVIRIVSKLDTNAVTGEWTEQKCLFCTGESSGYYDARDFTHREDCIVPLIEELQRTTYEPM